MTDGELLEAYRATGDLEVLDSVFAGHYPTVYHAVLKLVRNGIDASDLTQSRFLKAVESAESLRASSSLRNWLLTIAVNEVRQIRRAAARRNRPDALHELMRKGHPEPTQDADLLRREFEEHLERTLEQFPDDLKDPLVLHYDQNLSDAETAEVLGIPIGTLQFRMDLALQKLREDFRERGLLSLAAQFLPAKRLAR